MSKSKPSVNRKTEHDPKPIIRGSMLVVAGAQKAGTTSLYRTLASSSKIETGKYKEPQFFCMPRSIVEKHRGWYANLFDGDNQKLLIEASTLYLFHAHTPRLIRDYIEEPRVIAVVRDPAQRAYSAYWHMRKKEPRREQRTFRQILDRLEERLSTVETLQQAEDEELQRARRQKQLDADYMDAAYLKRAANAPFESHFEDRFLLYRYFAGSQYSRMLQPYEDELDGAVKVLVFEDLISNPEKTLRSVFEFVGLEPDDCMDDLASANPTRVPRGRLARSIFRARRHFVDTDFVRKYIKDVSAIRSAAQKLDRFFKTTFGSSKPKLPPEQYLRARELLSNEYDYWYEREPKTRQLWGDH